MIEIERVTKRFGRQVVLDDVSFSAPSGSVTGFVGPNGAGKSTLLRILAGVTFPDSGSTFVNGINYRQALSPARLLGVFLSAEWIPGSMSGQSYLSYVCETQGLPHSRARELLETVGLEGAGARQVRHYSLGMRQRLGVAAAIVDYPAALILDEPVNGLDPEGIVWLRQLLRDLANNGTAVLLSSHHMNELSMVADTIVLIDKGRIIRSGDLSSFLEEPQSRVYVESPDIDELCKALSLEGHQVERHGEGAIVTNVNAHEIGRVAYERGPGVTHLSIAKRSLEQTYFSEVGASSITAQMGKVEAK